MNKNIFLLDIPIFEPKYDLKKNYIYSNEKGKKHLKEVLLETSDDYCMYCYSKVLIDNKLVGHLEHSIEKSNSEKLKDCNINISMVCMKCNLSFKKVGESKRKLLDYEVSAFENSCSCNGTCIVPCHAYNIVKDKYLGKETAQIILQPFGVVNKVTNNNYKIQYDLLSQEFIVSEEYSYNECEIDFIKKHIIRFNLNDSEYRTREVINVCKDVQYFEKVPSRKRYNNLVADLFIDRLNSIDIKKAIKLCEKILLISEFKHKS